MTIPTDLQILKLIYNKYYKTFTSFDRDNPTRESKNYVPINIVELGDSLGVDGDIIFSRLYYHLEKKYGYKNEDGSVLHFFVLKAGDDLHCIHLPYAATVLADLQYENKKFQTITLIAIGSLLFSVAAFTISLFAI